MIYLRIFRPLPSAILLFVLATAAGLAQPVSWSRLPQKAQTTTLQSVCPDRDIFPKPSTPGLRNSYALPYQQDYPGIVYDATTGFSYWLDYRAAPDRPLEPINSYFTPVTYTSEKLFVLICGLHFDSTPSVAPTTILVADGGPQIDDNAAVPMAPAAPSPAPVAGPLAELFGQHQGVADSQADLELTKPRPARNPLPPPCDPAMLQKLVDQQTKAASRANNAVTHLNATIDEINRQLAQADLSFDDSGQPMYPPFWTPELQTFIQNLPGYVDGQLTPIDIYNPHNYVEAKNKVRAASQRLANAVSSWNSLLQSSDFAAAWKEFQKSSSQLKDAKKLVDEWNETYAGLSPERKACLDQRHLDPPPDVPASQTRYDNEVKAFDDESIKLSHARSGLTLALLAMNRWYGKSSISYLKMLPAVSGNGVTQIAIQIPTPAAPFVQTGMSIARVKLAPIPAPDPKPTVITVDRSTPHQTRISVGDGTDDGTSLNTIVSDTPAAVGAAGDSVSVHISSQTAAAPEPAPAVPASAPAAAGAPAPSAKDGASSAVVVSPSSGPAATYLVARHRFVNFVPSGGLLVSRFNPSIYNTENLSLNSITTTVTSTTYVATGSSGGTPITCANPPFTMPACTAPTVTVASATSTSNFAYRSPGGPFQETAIAGITWFPFASRDTYSVTHINSSMRPSIHTYSFYDLRSRTGFFVGTNVAGLGPFVVAPTFEFRPGIQLFAGVSLNSKTTLTAGIVPCVSPGSSLLPVTTQTGTSSANGLTTTSTVTVQTTSGCSNASATILGTATTVPTQTALVPAFSFGILLNSNLFKYLSFGQ